MHLPRILFITRKWAPAVGGMETYCVQLVKALREDRPVDVIALPGRSDGRTPSLGQLLGFPFTVLNQWLRLKDQPAIVHLGDLAIWPLALLHMVLAPKAEIVISAHGTDISYARRPTLLGKLYAAYQKIGAKLFPNARIIANSDATAKACRAIGWQSVSTCALATDMRNQAGVTPRADRILFAGRLIRQKGLSWFVREVLPALPETIGVDVAGIATDPDEASELEHPRVTFLGPQNREELARRYAQALCVIVPNIDLGDGSFEGFGLVACEAAAAGGIVLAADIGGLTAAVRDGETGFLLEPQNASQWQREITEIADWSAHQRTAFTRAASAAACQHYSWSRVANQTQAEYANVIAARSLA